MFGFCLSHVEEQCTCMLLLVAVINHAQHSLTAVVPHACVADDTVNTSFAMLMHGRRKVWIRCVNSKSPWGPWGPYGHRKLQPHVITIVHAKLVIFQTKEEATHK